jgi:hypothetical protein
VGTPIVATREKQETRIKRKEARFKEERWGKKLKPAKRLQLQEFFLFLLSYIRSQNYYAIPVSRMVGLISD